MKNIEIGKDAIKKELPVIPKLPGVYRMLNEKNEILYVGKAKNLPNRLKSYVSEKIILLEIKTDHCYNIKELMNRYQIQLDYYQQCLQKTTDKPIQTYLYSSHLDEAFSQF